MHHLLAGYIQAKEETLPYCNCPNCFNGVKKKSRNHVFCKAKCKDTFWLKIKGMKHSSRWHAKPPIYPGGFEQWKKDLEQELSNIFEQELFKEISMRYLVEDSKGYAAAIFMNLEGAEQYIELIKCEEGIDFKVIEINVEDIHEYM